ncbi:MAG: glycosyltransferase [Crocinitomicaceae bacterium]|nr:glycosyltransferase [Crocinitomicaceae bacterium]
MNSAVGYLVVYFIVIGGVILVGFFLHLKKSKVSGIRQRIRLDEITVLIPFRSEEKRLGDLLKSILNSNHLPKRFIFIDDHSEDESVKLIENELGNLPFEILRLPSDVSGKKRALRDAINICETKYILTWDADVSFNSNYFESIELLEEADMYVLPAVLIGNATSELFYELDFALANALNAGLSGWSRPIFSSGANFLFNRVAFHKVDDLESHAHMASGDDTYLLRDFRNNKKDIRLESNLNVAITTETPHTFKEFIDQRLRWVGKTTDIGDSLATLSATGQFAFAIGFFGLLIYFLVSSNWVPAAVLFSVKIGLDLVFFFPYFNRINRLKTWCLIPIYELLFPLYSLLLGILMISYRPKWKGRAIQSNKS